MEPPRPPVTVSTPGGPPQGPARPDDDRPDRGPGSSRRVPAGLAVAAVLVGLLVAVSGRGDGERAGVPEPSEPSPRPVRVLPPTIDGVEATASLGAAPAGRLLVQPLRVELELSPVRYGFPGAPLPTETDIVLQGVTARGFSLRLDGPPLPRVLADAVTLAEPRRVVLGLDAVVSDCSVGPQAQRQLLLRMQSLREVGTVRVAVQTDVVRALDRLVSRTCRRPRG